MEILPLSLLKLPWNDVVFKKVLSQLNLKDLFILRSVSKDYKILVETYFEVYPNINLAIHKKFTKRAFRVLSSCCRCVKKINISKCNWLSDDVLVYFLSNNNNIVELNLSYCNSIGNRSMQTLIINCKRLKCLQMASCEWLSTGSVDALTYHQDKLETVDFSKCVLLSERCIRNFVIKFNCLKNFSISCIPSVSDSIVYTIAVHCLELENLNINGCDVSINAIRVLITNCKELESVKIKETVLTREIFTLPYAHRNQQLLFIMYSM